mmetsp:Transcript_115350/g.337237  ORF Transcript_115350/g.337237 Transcript_115350/m.337237 type:complete len:133 (-) Transcript_115350:236-634(-)
MKMKPVGILGLNVQSLDVSGLVNFMMIHLFCFRSGDTDHFGPYVVCAIGKDVSALQVLGGSRMLRVLQEGGNTCGKDWCYVQGGPNHAAMKSCLAAEGKKYCLQEGLYSVAMKSCLAAEGKKYGLQEGIHSS